jgi:prevent-host-death family protein
MRSSGWTERPISFQKPSPMRYSTGDRERISGALCVVRRSVMLIVDLEDAKSRLGWLVERAAEGEPFIISVSGKPLVRVSTVDAPVETRLGFLMGEIAVPDDFDRMSGGEIEVTFGSGA